MTAGNSRNAERRRGNQIKTKTEDDKMKMYELFTAYYGDRRTAYEKPLNWIYEHQGNVKVEIRPTIWVWKATNSQIYFVDYVGAGVGCTLYSFDNYADARKRADEIGQMDESEFENWLINDHWGKRA